MDLIVLSNGQLGQNQKLNVTRPGVNCAGVCSPQAKTVYVGTGLYLVVLGQY